jgi:type IV secretion system protein VirB1
MIPGFEFLSLCAPWVAPETVQQIIHVESKGDPLAIHINGLCFNDQPKKISDASKAVALAQTFMSRGYSVDLGLMQVNSKNLEKLGYTVEQMFDPCINIRAGSSLLRDSYVKASATQGEGQGALKAALSAYNTGNFIRGFHNGYVAKYFSTHINLNKIHTSDQLNQKSVSVREYQKGQKEQENGKLLPIVTHLIPQQNSNPYTAETTIFKRGT